MNDKQCNRCGWEPEANLFDKLFGIGKRRLYSCKSPLCDLRGVKFCHKCMKDLGGSEYPSKCPRCNIGAIKNHGTFS